MAEKKEKKGKKAKVKDEKAKAPSKKPKKKAVKKEAIPSELVGDQVEHFEILPEEKEEVVVEDKPKEPRVYPPISKPVIKETAADRIPGVGMMNEVEIVAYSVGARGFRFGTYNRTPAKTLWKKKMSGLAAVQFLRKIKKDNKFGRLESKILPTD